MSTYLMFRKSRPSWLIPASNFSAPGSPPASSRTIPFVVVIAHTTTCLLPMRYRLSNTFTGSVGSTRELGNKGLIWSGRHREKVGCRCPLGTGRFPGGIEVLPGQGLL